VNQHRPGLYSPIADCFVCVVDPSGYVPCLEVILVVSRNLGYFLIEYYIPSILLVILSWVSFWISVDAVAARVNIGLLTVLTLTTQSTGSRDQMPRVSYVKAIDVWMSTCLVFAFASLIEFAIVNVWTRREARRAKTAGMSSLKAALSNTLPPPTTTTNTTTNSTTTTTTVTTTTQQQPQQICPTCRKVDVTSVQCDLHNTLRPPTITTTVITDDIDPQDDKGDDQDEQQQQQQRQRQQQRQQVTESNRSIQYHAYTCDVTS